MSGSPTPTPNTDTSTWTGNHPRDAQRPTLLNPPPRKALFVWFELLLLLQNPNPRNIKAWLVFNFSSISCRQKQRWLLWRCRRAPRSIPARRRRVLSNYSALSLYNGNKGKTKPHDASNTREQFESSLGTGFYGSLSLNPRLATSNCFWQIGRRRGIKDDCFNLQLKRGKIWTDRE